MINKVILYRQGVDPDSDKIEIDAVKETPFNLHHQRMAIPAGSLVVGRYSVLPFYLELEKDLKLMDSRLINSYRQHQFIADMREWCVALGDMTPKLYERLQDVPEKGLYVVKGQTNSRKHQWDTHMFANGKREVMWIYSRLKEDSLFQDQEIYARDYVPLKRLMTGFNGLPITKEFRFFVAYGKILTGGYYWASHVDDLTDVPEVDEVPAEFLSKAIDKVGDNASFYTLDVAQKEDGDWTVIEINDGQMSGLSLCDPYVLYRNLYTVIDQQPVETVSDAERIQRALSKGRHEDCDCSSCRPWTT